jgi:hypothetical protein
MPWTIWVDDRGLIWANAGDDLPGFNEALADSISALSPIGQPPALSTYWIDKALAGVERHSGRPISSGNATSLTRDGEEVVAESEYELFEDERMSVTAFVEGLRLWRTAVATAIQNNATISLRPGVTYWVQRNPSL